MAKVSRVSRWINDILDTEVRVSKRLVLKGHKCIGAKSGLPISRWLAAVFEMNEMRCLANLTNKAVKPLTDEQIKYNYDLEFGNRKPTKFGGGTINPGGALTSGKHTLNHYRNKFKLGTLYKGQARPILYPFRYSPEGHIVKDRGSTWFPTFTECQEGCIKYKIVDPRFFTVAEMEDIHQYAVQKGIFHAWSIPNNSELEDLYKFVPVKLYRCIRTYDLWKHDQVPKDFSPRSSKAHQIEDEKESTIEEENLTLEERRKRTLEIYKIQDSSETEAYRFDKD
jgi:hypothetical protein